MTRDCCCAVISCVCVCVLGGEGRGGGSIVTLQVKSWSGIVVLAHCHTKNKDGLDRSMMMLCTGSRKLLPASASVNI